MDHRTQGAHSENILLTSNKPVVLKVPKKSMCCCLPDEVGGLALVGEPLQRLGEHDGHVAAVHLAEREVAVQTRGSRLERKRSVIFKLSNSASMAIWPYCS